MLYPRGVLGLFVAVCTLVPGGFARADSLSASEVFGTIDLDVFNEGDSPLDFSNLDISATIRRDGSDYFLTLANGTDPNDANFGGAFIMTVYLESALADRVTSMTPIDVGYDVVKGSKTKRVYTVKFVEEFGNNLPAGKDGSFLGSDTWTGTSLVADKDGSAWHGINAGETLDIKLDLILGGYADLDAAADALFQEISAGKPNRIAAHLGGVDPGDLSFSLITGTPSFPPPEPVPSPATFGLGSLALLGLIGRRRRQRG